MADMKDKLAQLQQEGFVLIEGALSPEETENIRQRINYAREQGWEEGLNAVGNMWFDTLLDREPDTYESLVGHSSVRPYLEGLMGKQCQLRSLRAHINPRSLSPRVAHGFLRLLAGTAVCRGTSICDGTLSGLTRHTIFRIMPPGEGHLKFIKGGHLSEPPHLYPLDRPKFEAWCEAQEHVILYPKGGRLCRIYQSHPASRCERT